MTKRRSLGLVMMVLGENVLFAPILVGVWVIALLGVVLIAAGLVAIAARFYATPIEPRISHYLAGVLTIVLGLVLFLSPRVALSAVVLAITVGLLIDGEQQVSSRSKHRAATGAGSCSTALSASRSASSSGFSLLPTLAS